MLSKKRLKRLKEVASPIHSAFYQSYLRELRQNIYFYSEYPIEVDANGKETEQEGNPIDNWEFLPNYNCIKCLNEGNFYFISLFEAAILIGYRVAPSEPHTLIHNSAEFFADSFMAGEIDPRNPPLYIPYSKNTLYKYLYHDFIENFKSPDLSWLLTLKEVAEFAILKGYPENLFTDLLDIEEKNPLKKSNENKVSPINSAIKKLDPRERNTLLIIIAALCEKNNVSPSDRGLAAELNKITERLGYAKNEGTILKALKKVIDLTK